MNNEQMMERLKTLREENPDLTLEEAFTKARQTNIERVYALQHIQQEHECNTSGSVTLGSGWTPDSTYKGFIVVDDAGQAWLMDSHKPNPTTPEEFTDRAAIDLHLLNNAVRSAMLAQQSIWEQRSLDGRGATES